MFRGLSKVAERYLKVSRLIDETGNVDGLTDEQKNILFANIEDDEDEHFKQINVLCNYFNYLRKKYEWDCGVFAYFRKPIICIENELRKQGNDKCYYLEYGGFYNKYFTYRKNWIDIFEFKGSMEYEVIDQKEGAVELLGQFPLRNRSMCNKTLTSYVKLMNLILKEDVDEYTIQLLTDDPEQYKRVLKDFGDKIDNETLEASKEFARLMFGYGC